MGIGLSLAVIAAGAVLAFAVTLDIAGINVEAVGWILMLVGGVSLVLTFTYWRPRRQAAVVRPPPPAAPREPHLVEEDPEVPPRSPHLRDDPPGTAAP